MDRCQFQHDTPTTIRCGVCGFRLPYDGDADQVHRVCPLAPAVVARRLDTLLQNLGDVDARPSARLAVCRACPNFGGDRCVERGQGPGKRHGCCAAPSLAEILTRPAQACAYWPA